MMCGRWQILTIYLPCHWKKCEFLVCLFFVLLLGSYDIYVCAHINIIFYPVTKRGKGSLCLQSTWDMRHWILSEKCISCATSSLLLKWHKLWLLERLSIPSWFENWILFWFFRGSVRLLCSSLNKDNGTGFSVFWDLTAVSKQLSGASGSLHYILSYSGVQTRLCSLSVQSPQNVGIKPPYLSANIKKLLSHFWCDFLLPVVMKRGL